MGLDVAPEEILPYRALVGIILLGMNDILHTLTGFVAGPMLVALLMIWAFLR